MSDFAKPVIHSFSWIELNTSDRSAAKKFYSELFGWSMKDQQGKTPYTMALIGDKMVGGVTELAEQAKQMGAPPHWLSYVAVDSAADTANRVKGLGGKILLEPLHVGDAGIIAVAQDPTGGVFALWQATGEMGIWIYGETGALCWNELATDNVDAAGRFYANLFAWKTEAVKMENMTYTLFKRGDKQVGGMMPMPEMMKGAPTAWNAYFAVKDADATADKTRSLGGKILNPPTEIPNIGRFAVLQDPQGAVFAVLQPAS